MRPVYVFPISISLLLCSTSIHATNPNEIVEKVYNQHIIYRPGFFNHDTEGTTTLFTHSQKPQIRNIRQNVLKYDMDPQESDQDRRHREMVLMMILPGRDGRTHVVKTTDWPHSMCVQLSMIFKGKVYGGSGCIAGPQHILTCGHNVHNDNGWADSILAYPALNEASAPFGELKVAKVYTFKGWITHCNEGLDMALLILDKQIGRNTGWAGLLSLDDTSLGNATVNITGYPGDKGLKQMWTMSHTLTAVGPEQLEYQIDTAAGQSGSPIWIKKRDMPMIVGVHTTGSTIKNSGVRLSSEKFMNFAVRLISETYTIVEGQQPAPIVQGRQPAPARVMQPAAGAQVGQPAPIVQGRQPAPARLRQPQPAPIAPQVSSPAAKKANPATRVRTNSAPPRIAPGISTASEDRAAKIWKAVKDMQDRARDREIVNNKAKHDAFMAELETQRKARDEAQKARAEDLKKMLSNKH